MKRINVHIRMRPETAENISSGLIIDEETNTVNISTGESQYEFPFDRVLSSSCNQDKLFRLSGPSIIDDALNGCNGTVLTYGQTGAGKTYTMTGPSLDSPFYDEGYVMRSARYLFHRIRQSKDPSISVKLSILEIYNENLIDLLRDITNIKQTSPHTLPPIVSNGQSFTNGSSTIQPTVAFGYGQSSMNKLNILESPNGVSIPGLCILPLINEDEVLNYLCEVHRLRIVAEHQLNKLSSRSHVIYTFYITRAQSNQLVQLQSQYAMAPQSHHSEIIINENDLGFFTSKINLVDLAGSERVEKTGTTGQTQKEASYINKSLSFLEQVALALTQSKRDHIPYRQSKLTLLLKDSFGGNVNTLLIACVWPSITCEYETLSTLRFAARMKCIENRPIRNSSLNNSNHNSNQGNLPAKLRQQIHYLQRELIVRDMMIEANRSNQETLLENEEKNNEDGMNKQRPITSKTKESLLDLVSDLVSESPMNDLWKPSETHIQIDSYHHLRLLTGIMRNIVWESCQYNPSKVHEVLEKTLHKMKTPLPGTTHSDERRSLSSQGNHSNHHHTEISSTNHIDKNSVDLLRQESRNPNHTQLTSTAVKSFEYVCNEVNPIDNASQTVLTYEEFIIGPGKLLNESYFTAKETIKTNKLRQKEIIVIMNKQKSLIDETMNKINELIHLHDSHDLKSIEPLESRRLSSVHDNESEIKSLEISMKQFKDRYLTAKEELDLCKLQLQETESLKKAIMTTLLKSYEEYYQSQGNYRGGDL